MLREGLGLFCRMPALPCFVSIFNALALLLLIYPESQESPPYSVDVESLTALAPRGRSGGGGVDAVNSAKGVRPASSIWLPLFTPFGHSLTFLATNYRHVRAFFFSPSIYRHNLQALGNNNHFCITYFCCVVNWPLSRQGKKKCQEKMTRL